MFKKKPIKPNITTFVLVVFLALFISTYIILQSSWAFFKDFEQAEGNVTFGSIDVEWTTRDINENRIKLDALTFPDGPFLPGFQIDLQSPCYLYNKGNADMYLRVTVSIMYNEVDYTDCFSFGGITLSDTQHNAWIYDGVNNYYYNQKLLKNTEIPFISSIVANDSGDNRLPIEVYGFDLFVNFNAEAIQTENAAYEVWNPPANWVQLILN